MSDFTTESSTILLRRFLGKFRWLIAELFIVILGVFIALAIDEWQTDTEDSARETEYLAQLIGDLQTTEDLMADVRSTNSDMQDAAKKAISGVRKRMESRPRPNAQVVGRYEILLLPGA